MNIGITIGLIIFAGLLSGSFALPIKYVKTWRFENIWLQYAFWGFFILPWVIVSLSLPQILTVYKMAPTNLLLVAGLGGILFGIGQICFAFALDRVGLCLGFVINIGLGMSLGFLLPLVVQYPEQILTPFGLVTLFGIILAIIGLIFSSRAGTLRSQGKNESSTERSTSKNKLHKGYLLGILLAAISGLSAAEQNFVLSLTAPIQKIAIDFGASSLGAANIIWPIFLTFAFIPYAFYMLLLHYKNKSFVSYKQKGALKYFLFGIIMAICGLSALFIYSKAAQLIGKLGPLIGWPLFMVLIILTSNFWGFRHGEWADAHQKAKRTMQVGLMFLVFSVFILGFGTYLK